MRALFLITTFLFSLNAMAIGGGFFSEKKINGIEGFLAVKNLAKNPGAEKSLLGWTASGGAFTRTTTAANVLYGNASFAFNASATSQTATGPQVTIPVGLYGASCMAKVTYQGGDTDYAFQVIDGSTNILASQTITTVASRATVTLTFQCPSTGTMALRWISTANAASLFFDELYLGENYGFSDTAQSTVLGTLKYAGTSSCQWSTSSASLAAFAADTDCPTPTVTDRATAPGTKIPGITFTRLDPGYYEVKFQGILSPSAGASTTVCQYEVHDGTTGSSVVRQRDVGSGTRGENNTLIGGFNYTAGQSNITFQIRGIRISGDGDCNIINSDSATQRVEFFVTKHPSASQIAQIVGGDSWIIDANISGANIDLGTSDQTAYITPSNAGLTLVANAGSSPVGISCSSTNDNTVGATTCSAGSEEPGIMFDIPRSGTYRVCASFSHLVTNILTSSVDTTFQLVNTDNGSQTVPSDDKRLGKEKLYSAPSSLVAATASNPYQICGNFFFDSVSKKTIRLMYEQDITNTPTTNVIVGDASATVGQRDVHFTVMPVQNGIQNQYIKNSLFTGFEGQLRVEYAKVSSTGTVSGESVNWINGNAALASSVYTLTVFSGIFSGEPICTTNITTTGSGMTTINSATSTSVVVATFNDAGAATDKAFQIVCTGPR